MASMRDRFRNEWSIAFCAASAYGRGGSCPLFEPNAVTNKWADAHF